MQDKLVQLKERLQGAAQGVKITHRAVDVGNYTDVEDAVSSSIKEMGHIDILINNVTRSIYSPFTLNSLLTKYAGRPSPRSPKHIPPAQNPRHNDHEQHQHQRLHVHGPRGSQPLHDPAKQRHDTKHHLDNGARGTAIPRRGGLPRQQGMPGGVHECAAQ